MFAQSKPISSNQQGPHEQIPSLVAKHLSVQYRKPFQAHNLLAFEKLKLALANRAEQPLILDSCCGTALSSQFLAKNNPKSFVVGVDQSLHRLSKAPHGAADLPGNMLLLQANCEDIWRLCVAENIIFDSHYILYPNPWPKKSQLKRRWHGHPVFPVLPRLAKTTVLRSNWKIYLDEFNLAWSELGRSSADVSAVVINKPMTAFERKYLESKHTLYELTLSA